jgi:hypothetical protein
MDQPASKPLGIRTEDDNSVALVSTFKNEDGVDKAFRVNGPVLSGTSREYRRVSVGPAPILDSRCDGNQYETLNLVVRNADMATTTPGRAFEPV